MTAVCGHRGACGEAPENTLAGFAHAVAVGVDRIELDVRLSADEQLVVIHDETVDRTTDGTGRVADLTAAQLRRLDARRTCATWPERVGVPTFNEVLDQVAETAGLGLEVELKRDAPERLERVCASVARALRERAIDERVVVSSFDLGALEIMRSIASHLRRAFITAEHPRDPIATAARLGCSQIDIRRTNLSRDAVDEAHARGLAVTAWFGNSVDEVRTLLECGADTITTDLPSLALPLVREAARV